MMMVMRRRKNAYIVLGALYTLFNLILIMALWVMYHFLHILG